jgi:hypothetical protein
LIPVSLPTGTIDGRLIEAASILELPILILLWTGVINDDEDDEDDDNNNNNDNDDNGVEHLDLPPVNRTTNRKSIALVYQLRSIAKL